jgi:hypothetical protein
MQTDVSSASTTSTVNLVPYRCRVKGIWLSHGATAGTAVFYDSATTGTTTASITINTAAVLNDGYIPIPGEGVLFEEGVYVVLTNVASATIFYA